MKVSVPSTNYSAWKIPRVHVVPQLHVFDIKNNVSISSISKLREKNSENKNHFLTVGRGGGGEAEELEPVANIRETKQIHGARTGIT